MEPKSQGIRALNSNSCAVQLHNFMLTTGRLIPDGRLDIGVSIVEACGWLDVLTGDASWLMDLSGREDAVARIMTSARTAVDAHNTYWTKVQKSRDGDTGHLF